MPRHVGNPPPQNKGGAAVGELYSAARLLSKQCTAGAQEEVEVRDALAHCPQCGSGHFTEAREQR
jgi:hypothetical protein